MKLQEKGRPFSAFLLLLIVAFGCRPELAEQPSPQTKALFEQPTHFPRTNYDFNRNPLTEAGFQLGRKLFYDPILSRDSSISCASCHRQEYAFADGGKVISPGIAGRLGKRNSPALFNLAWSTSFMWDGGVNHLEVFPLAPITEPAEMDESLARVIEKLGRHPSYPAMFESAFGPGELNDQRFLFALAQFQLALVSADSPYDRYLLGNGSLPAAALQGRNVFLNHCSGCHGGVLLTDHSFRNNGIDSLFVDAGRGRITQLAADTGRFKVPSLRNVALTAPYMHDGRFSDLSAVLLHYQSGVIHSNTLDPILQNAPGLTNPEIEQLQAFLEQLTDQSFIYNPRFSNPF